MHRQVLDEPHVQLPRPHDALAQLALDQADALVLDLHIVMGLWQSSPTNNNRFLLHIQAAQAA